MMSSVRNANNYIGGMLEVAAEHVENGVRRATNDCVRKTPKVLVVEHRDAGKSRQGLVVENVAVTADGIGRDRPYQSWGWYRAWAGHPCRRWRIEHPWG